MCDSELFFDSEYWPSGIAYDGERIWVNGFTSGETYVYDVNGNQLDTLITPFGFLSGMTIVKDTLWMVVEQSGILNKLNKNTGEFYASYTLPLIASNTIDPNHFGLTYDGGNLWVSEYSGDIGEDSYIYKISPVDGSPLDSIAINHSSILPIFFIGTNLYGIESIDKNLYQIDTETGAIEFIDKWCVNLTYDVFYDQCKGLIATGTESYGVYKINDVGILELPPTIIEVELCEGEIYKGVPYFESITLVDTFEIDCVDSLVYTFINVHPIGTSQQTISLLPGGEYNGNVFFSDTIITENLLTVYGCDSIVTTNIMVEISNAAEKELMRFQLYPNPAQSVLNIYKLTYAPVTISIFDNTGIMVHNHWYSSNEFEIDVSHLPKAGVLFNNAGTLKVI